MPIGYGKSQNMVYDWLKEIRKCVTSKEVGDHFGKSTEWAYKILTSLEDAYRVYATSRSPGFPIRWQIKEREPE